MHLFAKWNINSCEIAWTGWYVLQSKNNQNNKPSAASQIAFGFPSSVFNFTSISHILVYYTHTQYATWNWNIKEEMNVGDSLIYGKVEGFLEICVHCL